MNEEQLQAGRDIVAALDATIQASHMMLGPLSRTMKPDEIEAARKALESAEMKLIKLRLRYPEKR